MCRAIFNFCSSLFFCACDFKGARLTALEPSVPIPPKNRKNMGGRRAASSILVWPTLEEYSPKYKEEDCSLWIQFICSQCWEDKALLCQHQIMAGFWIQEAPPLIPSLEKLRSFFFPLSYPPVKIPSFKVGLKYLFLHKTFPEPSQMLFFLPHFHCTFSCDTLSCDCGMCMVS